MIQIESLLNEFCPKGVEFKTIESISIKIVSGGTPKTNNMSYYGGNIPYNDEDISFWPEEKIWEHLKGKIYDSTLTILLISPNMKEIGKWQRSQWIPWEISFSLRETTRNNRKSHNNAILAVILPDKNGKYDYYSKDKMFPIVKDNITNGYIYVVNWDDFLRYPQADIEMAFNCRQKTPTYKIIKTL